MVILFMCLLISDFYKGVRINFRKIILKITVFIFFKRKCLKIDQFLV